MRLPGFKSGGPYGPNLEPEFNKSPDNPNSVSSPTIPKGWSIPSDFSSTEKFSALFHRNRTVLCTPEGQKPLPSHPRTPASEPLGKAKRTAWVMSHPGFRITVYNCTRRGRERINVEVQGTRVKGKHTWKRTKLCDTQDEAIEFIKAIRKEVVKNKLVNQHPEAEFKNATEVNGSSCNYVVDTARRKRDE